MTGGGIRLRLLFYVLFVFKVNEVSADIRLVFEEITRHVWNTDFILRLSVSSRRLTSAKHRRIKMANCCEMKEGDLFVCDACGLELIVKKACTCDTEAPEKCNVPLQCCNQKMTKK